MRLHLIAAGTRMPEYVDTGYHEYARRLPPQCSLLLREIPLGHRGKGANADNATAVEGERMLAALPQGAAAVALDVGGRALSTPQLAQQLAEWLADGRDRALLVGGPDGLAPACLERAELRWSLSPLTLPHGLVRVVVAEQIYRAWSILQGHPYHR